MLSGNQRFRDRAFSRQHSAFSLMICFLMVSADGFKLIADGAHPEKAISG
jgi:hypothetical protein